MSLTLIRSRITEYDVIPRSVSEFPASKFAVELLCVFGSGCKSLYQLLAARCLRRVLHPSEHKVVPSSASLGTNLLLLACFVGQLSGGVGLQSFVVVL
jgi:hypothetical protein